MTKNQRRKRQLPVFFSVRVASSSLHDTTGFSSFHRRTQPFYSANCEQTFTKSKWTKLLICDVSQQFFFSDEETLVSNTGGQIHEPHHSTSFNKDAPVVSFFGIPLYYNVNSPRVLIQVRFKVAHSGINSYMEGFGLFPFWSVDNFVF